MLGPFTKDAPLTIAVSKGRVAKHFLSMLKEAGYDCSHHSDRSLMAEDLGGSIRILYAKSADVLTYVERAVADLGVVGSDLLMEQSPRVYELAELPIGRCRLCIAGRVADQGHYGGVQGKGFGKGKAGESLLRIATKYPELARKYLKDRGLRGEIILLNGSVELGPLLGLSDIILDIVETGKTLAENNLVVLESLSEVSTRLVANKAYYKTRHGLCSTFMERLTQSTQQMSTGGKG